MKTTGLLLLALSLILAVACSSPEPIEETRAAVDDLATRAAAIASEIEADPDSAEEILDRHGLTVEEFEEMIYEISADPELSRAYEAARTP